MITFGQLGANQPSSDISYDDMPLENLIQELKAADMNLRIAIEQDEDSNIRAAEESLKRIVDHLLAFECTSKKEGKVLYNLLFNRFVTPELADGSVGHNVCKKVLAHFE